MNNNKGVDVQYYHLGLVEVFLEEELKTGDIIGESGTTGRSIFNSVGILVLDKGEAINPKEVIDF